MSYNFNAKETKDKVVQFIRDWFEENGKGCTMVVGVSGGKDSTIALALGVQALGKSRVFGVLMPNGEQKDIEDSIAICESLGVGYITINIHDAVQSILDNISSELWKPSDQTIVNLPPRIRMSTLYAVSQSVNGRVANTCNLSEDYVGYSTRYGDSVGDFSPLGGLTVQEIKAIGRLLPIPQHLVEKTPSDGLCGKTDEDNLGFTYETLDRYIREGICEDEATKKRIDDLHKRNLFKLQLMPTFRP